MLQELDHELLVVVICPGVGHSLAVFLLVEGELSLEQVQEVFKQEIHIDVSTNVFR